MILTELYEVADKHTKDEWNKNHVLFMQDSEYIKELIKAVLK